MSARTDVTVPPELEVVRAVRDDITARGRALLADLDAAQAAR